MAIVGIFAELQFGISKYMLAIGAEPRLLA